jgi:hypothetical protein
MKKLLIVAGVLLPLAFAAAEGKKKKQEVNFEDQNVDGKLNSPDAAYLVQKRGVRFIPLYKVNDQFEKHILESVEYLR